MNNFTYLGEGEFDVEIVPPFHLMGEKVSSTLIREHLLKVRWKKPVICLGDPTASEEQSFTGRSRDERLDFRQRTLSSTDHYVIPVKGVYAVSVLLWRTGYCMG